MAGLAWARAGPLVRGVHASGLPVASEASASGLRRGAVSTRGRQLSLSRERPAASAVYAAGPPNARLLSRLYPSYHGHGYGWNGAGSSRPLHSSRALLADKRGDGEGGDEGAAGAAGGKGSDDDEDGEGDGSNDDGKKRKKSRKVKRAPSTSSVSDDATDSPRVATILVEGQSITALMAQAPVPEKFSEVVMLPVDRAPLFPFATQLISVSDPVMIKRLKRISKSSDPWVGVFLRKKPLTQGEEGVTDLEAIHNVGTFSRILSTDDTEDMKTGKPVLRVLLYGIRRIEATGTKMDDNEFVSAEVENVIDKEFESKDIRIQATIQELMKTLQDIMNMNSLWQMSVKKAMHFTTFKLDDPVHITFFVLSLLTGTVEGAKLQELIESTNLEERLPRVLELLKKELLQAKLQQEIAGEVEKQVSDRNRQAMLYEQLKAIKKELGLSKDDKDAVAEKFRERLSKLTSIPPETLKVIEEELNKLSMIEPNSSEFNVTRNYLDWLTALPWGKTTTELLDIDNAQGVLDEDHFGMKDAKDRILEFIAIGKLRGKVQGKILLLVGPPGVGKTSIGKSIARALNRKYFRFSVGGLHDVAEIKGHRRTYVGAMPGKAIQCLKKCESENPLVLIDEVDKIGRAHNGDPTSALLEMLDPEQNSSFVDHYLDVPVDLSKVLFLCTANTTDTIPGPLLDRMEVIELSGYMAAEKQEIARNYVIPHALEAAGIKPGQVSLPDEVVSKLIREYCRESGVRNLQKQIEKLLRKAALKLVRGPSETVDITTENLKDFVGNPIFRSERLYEVTPPGVIMGLAWTSMGGATLYIETVRVPTAVEGDKPGLSVTGQLGDVMKESTQLAYAFAKGFLLRRDAENNFFREASVNLHVPEGATPKDGPSAGVTMTTALLSLALGRTVRQDLAMTGEISLTGMVLRVGGIKEKMLAAKRSGVKCVVLPAGNEADFVDLPTEIKDGLEVHYATTYDDVFRVAFQEASQ